MIRVKDIEKSLKFYQNTMGMTLLRTVNNEKAEFNLYFLGYGPALPAANGNTATREGLLELTYNYGTEKVENFAYHNGNDPLKPGHANDPKKAAEKAVLQGDDKKSEPKDDEPKPDPKAQGFGHICVSVDDLEAACARFTALKVTWKKEEEGEMPGIVRVYGAFFFSRLSS